MLSLSLFVASGEISNPQHGGLVGLVGVPSALVARRFCRHWVSVRGLRGFGFRFVGKFEENGGRVVVILNGAVIGIIDLSPTVYQSETMRGVARSGRRNRTKLTKLGAYEAAGDWNLKWGIDGGKSISLPHISG